MNPLRTLWRLLDSNQRRRFVALQLLSVGMAFSTLGGIASLAPFLLVLSDPALVGKYAPLAWLHGRLAPGTEREFAVLLGLLFGCAVSVANIVGLLGTLAMTRFAMRVGDGWHAALMDEYLHRDYAFHARTGVNELFDRVVFSVNRVAAGMLDSALALASNLLIVLAIVASVIFVSPLVALIALAWLGAGYLLLYSAARRRILALGREEAAEISRRTRLATEGLGAIKEVLLLGSQAYFREGFARACRSITGVSLRSHATAQGPRFALETATVLGLIAAALFVSRNRPLGAWLAELTFLGFSAYRLLPALQQVFVALVRIRGNEALLAGIADDLTRAVRHAPMRGAPAAVPVDALAPRRELVLDRVSFAYREGAPVLRDVSVTIPVGTIVGFSGPNGSGKTTLVDVLMGLLEPDSGDLRVDGVRIDASNRTRWRRSIAYVPQDPYLLRATLAQNIAFGRREEAADHVRLDAAVRAARLDMLVARLANGVDEPIGQGERPLSGGERQRVAIARALYRDAPVLVLDEATSALDGDAERDILELLVSMRGTRTVVLIAHRTSTLDACDLVFELDAGRLRTRGPAAARDALPRGAAHA